MNITAPITDYIPASLMTTDGDMVSRRDGQPAREQPYGYGNVKQSRGAGVNLGNTLLVGVLDTYLKGQGGATPAIFQALALRDTGTFMGDSSVNAGGDEVIVGVGFQPSIVFFFAIDQTVVNMNYSWGADNGVIAMCVTQQSNATVSGRRVDKSIFISRGGGNDLRAEISAIGADGFTITWTLAGACAVDYIYICLP